MSASIAMAGAGPYIVFPNGNCPFVCEMVTAKDVQMADVIIATQTMEVLKNRFGPSGPISGTITNLCKAQEQIDEVIKNMSRKAKW